MNCCGNIIEITDMDDAGPRFLCQRCGKQGPGVFFPDPAEEPVEIDEYFSIWQRVTRFFARLMQRVSR